MRKKPIKCTTLRCKNRIRFGKTLCETCRKRKWNKEHPAEYSFANLKSSAAKREIFFGLTFDEFMEFAYQCDYLNKRGRGRAALTVDRKIPGRLPGYVRGNIQPATGWQNSKKRQLEYNYITGEASIVEIQLPQPSPDDPF